MVVSVDLSCVSASDGVNSSQILASGWNLTSRGVWVSFCFSSIASLSGSKVSSARLYSFRRPVLASCLMARALEYVALKAFPSRRLANLPMTDQEIGLLQGCLILDLSPLLGKPWSGVLGMGFLWKDQTSRHIPKLMVAS